MAAVCGCCDIKPGEGYDGALCIFLILIVIATDAIEVRVDMRRKNTEHKKVHLSANV